MTWRDVAEKRSAALILVAVLALCGCMADPFSETTTQSTASASASSGETSAPSTAASETAATTQPATSGGSSDTPVAWVPPGPVDPLDPPPSKWYFLFENKDCNGLTTAIETGDSSPSSGIELWKAAAAVCHAVYSGQQQGWADAAAVMATLQEPTSCLDRAVYQVVAGLLTVHAQNPATAPVPVAGAGSACPLQLTGLDAIGEFGPEFSPTATPSSGLAGGLFQLSGQFVDVVAVMVGDQRVPVTVDPVDSSKWNVLIPPAAAAGTVTVTAEGSAGPIPGSLQFSYVDEGASTQTPTQPSDEPTITVPSETPSVEPSIGDGS